jgi:hypothetical protein
MQQLRAVEPQRHWHTWFAGYCTLADCQGSGEGLVYRLRPESRRPPALLQETKKPGWPRFCAVTRAREMIECVGTAGPPRRRSMPFRDNGGGWPADGATARPARLPDLR